ncbi:hypothetical protein ABEB36_013060 [Hypothenemus hampei]|uniref:Uncharacterized protein n=1 Tax=Hypothenemus hampei TaxID=57062 RepID=A0ABD1EB52_HYPHA
MLSQNIELPFLPQYKTEQIGDGPTIKVTWFEPRFSQSHYKIHNRSNGSNACTLIVIIMAYKCHTYNVIVNDPNENLNIRLIHLLAISMLEGNAIHEELQLKNLLNDPNLNVPEALKYTKQKSSNLVEWKSAIYMERLSRSLYDNIRHNYKEWLKSAKNPYEDLYVLLIADSRTVLFLFQAKSNTVSKPQPVIH